MKLQTEAKILHDSDTSLNKVRDYWEGYVERVLARGTSSRPQDYFKRLRKDHEEAYALANYLLHRWGVCGKSLLELGCGMGFDTITLTECGANVLAIDISDKCLELTRRHLSYYGLKAELVSANAEQLDFPAASFDFVTARGILMFTPNPSAVLEQILKVLRPGGRVQAIMHNKNSWYVMLAKIARMNLVDASQDPEPNRLYTRSEVRALFRNFNNVEIRSDRFPTMIRTRTGLAAKCFNSVVVPMTRRIPKRFLRPYGFYFIVNATKPEV